MLIMCGVLAPKDHDLVVHHTRAVVATRDGVRVLLGKLGLRPSACPGPALNRHTGYSTRSIYFTNDWQNIQGHAPDLDATCLVDLQHTHGTDVVAAGIAPTHLHTHGMAWHGMAWQRSVTVHTRPMWLMYLLGCI